MPEYSYDVPGDDGRLAKILTSSLNALASGPDGLLSEMARDVLRGHLDLRTAAMSDVYGEALSAGLDRYYTFYDGLGPAERRILEQQTIDQLDAMPD